MDSIDCAVIGAGIVGLAAARALAQRGREVVVLEAASGIGTGISSRNSEVIHAGLYYPAGSLKARLCVAGARRLYAYCAERSIGYRRCGKLIVATRPEQEVLLQQTLSKARRNGVQELQALNAAAARRLEPALHCSAALLSPATGIVDSHALMLSLLADAEADGALLALRSPVLGGHCRPDGIVLAVGGAAPTELHARHVINCAGLGAQGLARQLAGLPTHHIPPLHYAKGNYFSLRGRSPFGRLIYPVPEADGLGVHLTLDLAGQARFGPDVEWVEHLDYRVDPRRAEHFYSAIRRYWPGLPADALLPDYAGIRPKPHAPGDASRDFIVAGPAEHGVAGLINLFGIESPGLTASLALGEYIAGLCCGFP